MLEIVKKIPYQINLLEKAFATKKSLLSIIEVLNLEKYDLARISFCSLIQFAYEHNADIIRWQVPDGEMTLFEYSRSAAGFPDDPGQSAVTPR